MFNFYGHNVSARPLTTSRSEWEGPPDRAGASTVVTNSEKLECEAKSLYEKAPHATNRRAFKASGTVIVDSESSVEQSEIKVGIGEGFRLRDRHIGEIEPGSRDRTGFTLCIK